MGAEEQREENGVSVAVLEWESEIRLKQRIILRRYTLDKYLTTRIFAEEPLRNVEFLCVYTVLKLF